jgi:hypothetical protein
MLIQTFEVPENALPFRHEFLSGCKCLSCREFQMFCFLTSGPGVAEVPVISHDLKYLQYVIRDSIIQITPASYSRIRTMKQSQYVT